MHMSSSMKKDSLRTIILLVVILIAGGFIIGTLKSNKQTALVVMSNAEVQTSVTITGNPLPFTKFTNGIHLSSYFSKTVYNKNNAAQYSASSGYSEDPQAKAAVDLLGPSVLRFPAGTDSRYYHLYDQGTTNLAKGYGYRNAEIDKDIQQLGEEFVTGWYGLPSRYLSYEQTLPAGHNFIIDAVAMAQAKSTKMLIVANVINGTPSEVVAEIGMFKSGQVGIAGVELGNETYNTKIGYNGDATAYVNAVKPFAQAIKTAYPGVKVGLVAAPRVSPNTQNFDKYNNWNSTILDALTQYPNLFDTYIVHGYMQLRCDAQGDDAAITSCANARAYYIANDTSEAHVKTVSGVQMNNPTIDEYFSYYKNKFVGKNMWLSEWGLSHWTGPTLGDSGYYANTLLQAQFIGEYQNKINAWNASNGNMIEYATLHNLDGYEAYSLISPLRANQGETEVDMPGSVYARRAAYYTELINKKITSAGLKIASASLSTSEMVTVTPYVNDTTGMMFLYFSNRSGKTVSFPEVTYNGVMLNTTSRPGTKYVMGATTPNAAKGMRGSGDHMQQAPEQISIDQGSIPNVASYVVPPYAYGYISFPINEVIQNHAPSFSVTAPSANGVFTSTSATQTLSGIATDQEDSTLALSWTQKVLGVTVGTGQKSVASGASWSTPITLSTGDNVITFTVTDSGSLVGTSQITISYTSNDTTPPTSVNITNVVNGSVKKMGTVVSFAGTAFDNVGVTKFDYYANNVLVCTAVSQPYLCTWTVPTTTFGKLYTIYGKASDAAGNYKNTNDYSIFSQLP